MIGFDRIRAVFSDLNWIAVIIAGLFLGMANIGLVLVTAEILDVRPSSALLLSCVLWGIYGALLYLSHRNQF